MLLVRMEAIMTKVDPEHESIDAFVQYCIDDEVETFTPKDVTLICMAVRRRRKDVRVELEGYGLTYMPPGADPVVRGFKSNNHDRWSAYKSHGGSGWSQIIGFAGVNGW